MLPPRTTGRGGTAIPAFAFALAFAGPSRALPPAWPPGWDDGRAEVAAYASREPRYGTTREAEEFVITVTEVQDRARLVKALADAPPETTRAVIKLNREITVPTGVYTYRQMSSAFVDRATLAITKVVASSQEWCGTTFVEALAQGGRLRIRSFSYFDGEGDREADLAWPDGAWAADALPLLVRTLPSDAAGRIESKPFLPTLVGHRVREPRVVSAEIAWTAPTRTKGSAPTQVVSVRTPEGDHELLIEAAAPRRVLRWSRPDGGTSELRSARRLAYWTLTGDPDRALRQDLLRGP